MAGPERASTWAWFYVVIGVPSWPGPGGAAFPLAVLVCFALSLRDSRALKQSRPGWGVDRAAHHRAVGAAGGNPQPGFCGMRSSNCCRGTFDSAGRRIITYRKHGEISLITLVWLACVEFFLAQIARSPRRIPALVVD
jgi:hypothetical protein